MKKYNVFLLTGLAILLGIHVQAQTIQWASEVIDVSSELGTSQYSSKQALGKPNVLPAGGESPNAWTPNSPNRKEFIKLAYETPMRIRQIAVGESYNPSAITAVYLYDIIGNEYLVSEFEPTPVPVKGRIRNIFIEETTYEVAAVKLDFDGDAVPGYFSIDAIAISDSYTPIEAVINLSPEVNTGLQAIALGPEVNTEYKELRPLISPDGKTLYFSRRNHPGNVGGVNDYEDIWYSKMSNNGEWMEAVNAGAPLNTRGPNFISSISMREDSSMVLLLGNRYRENGRMEAGVSMSVQAGEDWTKPYNLEIVNEYNYNQRANFFLASNMKVMLMSVERDDSYGDRDLYVSFLQNDSLWTEPLNMGSILNSADEDGGPFLHGDMKTLYFSSKGHSGYGGSDIYVSRRLDDTWTNWTEPENLGPDINTEGDDLFFNMPASGEYAYYTKAVGEDDADVYVIPMPIFAKPEPVVLVKGRLLDEKTKQPIGAKIIYERLTDGEEVGITYSDPETGEYQLVLPAGEMYGFHAEKDGYMAKNENVDLTSLAGYEEYNDDMTMVPIEERAKVELNNVFFDFDKASLKPESYPELKRVAKMLSDQRSMKVELSGHTDFIGTEEYNMGLSQRRAEAVKQYLIQQGAGTAQVQARGYGEAKPVESNDTEEGRSLNRRVELEILEM